MPISCEWAEWRHGRLYRCVNKSVKAVHIDGEAVYLCSTHEAIARRMMKRKADYEKLLEALHKEVEDLKRAIEDLRRKQESG